MPGSLFATCRTEEAWRLARRLEFHFTPKHANWLNIAECELSVLSGQCLDRRLSSKEAVAAEVGPWEAERNRIGVRLVWGFRVADAPTLAGSSSASTLKILCGRP